MILKYLPLFIISALFVCGCATTEYKSLPEAPVKKIVEKPKGIYHKVQKGETLFRVAKSYGVSVEDVISANNIPNAAAIEIGQLLLIPGANEVKVISTTSTPDENKEEFIWPIKGKVISYFKDHRGEGINKGVDIQANEGDVVKAVREGKVVLADYMSAYHQTVMIDHGDGFISVYSKNRKLLVKLGEHVSKGDSVAEVGTEAGKSFLHFEIRKGKEATNPLFYLP
ncbi:MAG: peptidoglycan DD-metalloendopeptidase family protein [Candidatus Omnitrophica bacterium]|nr:peptidoglycan DD-metalloendopeptidase family protein [Candidatus Omnitrophota bacterium]